MLASMYVGASIVFSVLRRVFFKCGIYVGMGWVYVIHPNVVTVPIAKWSRAETVRVFDYGASDGIFFVVFKLF